MKQYSTNAGLNRGLLYHLVKAGKRKSINLTSIGMWPADSDRYVDNIIDYDNDNFYTSVTNSSFGQWILVELIDRFIDLKAYAMMTKGRNYPKSWDIQVSMDGNQWNTPHTIRNNDDSYNGHIFKFTKHIGFIRFFKIINRGLNAEGRLGNNEIYLNNIDLYGNVVECYDNCTVIPHIYFSNYRCQTNKPSIISLISFIILVSK